MARFRNWIAMFGALALGVAVLPRTVGAEATALPVRPTIDTTAPGLPPAVNGVAPGPEILHRPPARGPQFENTGVWKADPTKVCMTSAYRSGEFLYQDCLWDDNGGGPAYRWWYYTAFKTYRYPTDPSYRDNAADIVEVRLKPLDDATAVRVTYNTMVDPNLVAATIALGGDAAKPVAVPHGANTKMPAEVFVTASGDGGDIVDAATGQARPERPTVTTDLERRQVEIRDHASAFFNVAFRYDEPFDAAWRDHLQLAAVEQGDLSPFFATVDFTKLAAATNDDMAGERGGVPTTGFMSMLFASHFETNQGRRIPSDPNEPRFASFSQQHGFSQGSPGTDSRAGLAFGWPCRDDCTPDLAGNLQRYLLYVPKVVAQWLRHQCR